MSAPTVIFVERRGPDFEARYWRDDEGRYFYRVAYDPALAVQRLVRDHGIAAWRVVKP